MTRSPITHDISAHGPEGLAVDLPLLLRLARPVPRLGRRQLLAMLGGVGALTVVAACGSKSGTSSSSSAATTNLVATSDTTTLASTAPTTSVTTTQPTAGSLAGAETPDETAGPYPGDGTNGPNALTESGIVRSDIRSSFGSSTTTAEGIPLTYEFTVVDAATGAALPGAALYLWHCDRDGDYSMYASGKTSENYLRGMQTADANGKLSFQSIYPGCYSGRWPHAHFEVYDGIGQATNGSQATKISQLALPADSNDEAFATNEYAVSAANFAGMSLAGDRMFSDGVENQTPTMSGNPTDGYTANLVVRV